MAQQTSAACPTADLSRRHVRALGMLWGLAAVLLGIWGPAATVPGSAPPPAQHSVLASETSGAGLTVLRTIGRGQPPHLHYDSDSRSELHTAHPGGTAASSGAVLPLPPAAALWQPLPPANPGHAWPAARHLSRAPPSPPGT